MRSGTIALLIGIAFFQQLSWLPHPGWVAIATVSLPLACRWRILRLPLWGIAGFSWALLHANMFHNIAIPQTLEGEMHTVIGEVISIPASISSRSGMNQEISATSVPLNLRFDFRVEQLEGGLHTQKLPFRTRLAWYGAETELKAGQRWQFSVRLKRPSGFMNPGGFDYEGWLYQQKIVATGSIGNSALNTRIQGPPCIFCLYRWRQLLADHLDNQLHDSAHRGLVKALIIGERSGISSEQWELLARTGTSHLMAISGLHIGLVAGLAFWAGRRLWSCSWHLTLLLPAHRAAAFGAMLAALVYAGLAGFSLPTVRALIMVCIAMLSLLHGRSIAPSHVLAMALLAVLLMDPFSVLSAGFWLSFGAVAVILYGMACRIGDGGWWWKWGRVQWLVAAGLLPMTLFWFQRASLISPVANLLAVPVTGVLVVPLCLAATLVSLLWPDADVNGAGGFLFFLVDRLLEGQWWTLQQLAAVPGAMWVQAVPSIWVLLLSMTGVAILLAPGGLPRLPGFILLLPMLVVQPEPPDAGEVWLTVLDVGQGLAVAVQTREHLLVYDTGPGFSQQFDAGSAVVIPYLRQQGVTDIDTLVVSHANLDHSGGLNSVMRMLPVEKLLSGEPLPQAQGEQITATRCHEGQGWQWDGVDFRILHPPAEYSSDNANDHSCVLQVQTEGGSLLLTGDIQQLAELRLSHRYGESLSSSILIAPHHGSRTSSSNRFISLVHPEHVIFSTGYANHFGHPHREVRERLQRGATELSDTARHGAVQYKIHPHRGIVGPKHYRLDARRYWNRTNSQN